MEYDWKTVVQNILDEMIIEEELPLKSLYLMPNYGKDGKNITSFSVCIYEVDYPDAPNTKKDPTRNLIVLNIKERGANLELLIDKVRYGNIGAPIGTEIKELKSDDIYMHVIIPANHAELANYIKKNAKYAYVNYQPKVARFGCCGNYKECSNAKKCIHENKLYSKACFYRENLEAGRIFYGKNCNIN